jgi:carboxyl-terminal processing protease
MKHLRYPSKLSVVFIITLALVACQFLSVYTPSNTVPPDVEPNFRLMAEAWNTIQRIYVDREAINPKLLTYGAIGGMVDALGDTGHSRFLSPEMLKQERSLTKGEFEGIGAEVRMRNGQLVIVAPIDGSPAQRAGLKAGDIILKVDGKEVTGLPLNQAVDLILGPAGSPVKLTILNEKSGRSKEVPLIRARVTFQSVSWYHLPGATVAHLRVAAFNNGVSKDLRKILSAIQEEGMTGIILDLRNNPGGLYEEAVAAASQFLKEGNVLFEKDALGKTKPVEVRPGGIATSIPVVVLINGGTSSGAEIVAGALQDANRARLVGEKTFGTGTVLQTYPLSDGSALMLAVQEWLTPSGHTLWHQGISPDVVVPLPPEVIPLIPVTEKGLTAKELGQSQDVQLLRALDLLSKQSGLSKQWRVG